MPSNVFADRFAVLDIGSNTVRYLVARRDGDRFIPLHSSQIITRLGERAHATGELSDAAMTRTLDGIASLIDGADGQRPVSVAAVATHAVRNATNGPLFKERFDARFGFGLAIIDWQREAELSLMGAAMVIGSDGPVVLFDIGGGSTEFIHRDETGDIRAVGTDLGVVRLAETFIAHAPLRQEEYRALEEYLQKETADIPVRLGLRTGFTLVGTAGTVTSIAAIRYGVSEYAPELINNRRITDEDVWDLLREIGDMTIAERSALAVLENGREDLIIPGMGIVLAVMKSFGVSSLVVSDAGLREGALLALARGALQGATI